jgi:hypothetical protein
MSYLTSILESKYNVEPLRAKMIAAAYEAEKKIGGTEAAQVAAAVGVAIGGKVGTKRKAGEQPAAAAPAGVAPLTDAKAKAMRVSIGKAIIREARKQTLTYNKKPYSTAVIGAIPRQHVQQIFGDDSVAKALFAKTKDTTAILSFKYGEDQEEWGTLMRFFGWDAPLISNVPDKIPRYVVMGMGGGGSSFRSWAGIESIEVKLSKGTLTVKTRTYHASTFAGSWNYGIAFGY